MGMYTGLRAHPHPEIHPGLGRGVLLPPHAPCLPSALPAPGRARGQARRATEGLEAAPWLPRLCLPRASNGMGYRWLSPCRGQGPCATSLEGLLWEQGGLAGLGDVERLGCAARLLLRRRQPSPDPRPQPGRPAPAPGCAAEPELVLPGSTPGSSCGSPCSQPSPRPRPAEELPCKEQVVPFTVSPRLLHSPFLHPTGKRGGGCGNVLALQRWGGRKCARGVPRGRGVRSELPAWPCRPSGRHRRRSLPPPSG